MNDQRFHLVLTSAGQRVMHGWWADEATARRKYTRWIGEHGSMPESSVTLIDTATGSVLTSWPDEP